MLHQPPPKQIWVPIPGSSQELALDSRCHHTLYTGARGATKTDTQLMRFRRNVGMGYGAFWRGIILDREYKNLDDLVTKSKRWFPQFGDGARFLESGKDFKWVWPSKEELLFRAVKKEDDYWNYHGHEYPFIGWNELCKYPMAALYNMMMSCNRSSYLPEVHGYQCEGIPDKKKPPPPPPIPLEVFSTTNPYGPGHHWVKREFIDPAPYGQVVRKVINVFNPRTQKREDITITQVAIFGSYRENIYLAPEYIASLESISDPNKRKAWLHGDWNIVAGGALDDVWSPKLILPQFDIPNSWHIDRAFDWGSTHPFSVGWFAEANGEEAKLKDGTSFCPPPGTLIQFSELYGTNAIGTNEGVKWSSTKIAEAIRDHEIKLLEHKLIPYQPWPGPADNQIRSVVDTENDTIEATMAKVGIRWKESDKSPGSRVVGLQLMRDRCEASHRGERPGYYVTNNNRVTIAILPSLPRDDVKIDDVDTDAEDHVWDMTRYRVLAGTNRTARSIKVTFAT